MIHHLQTTLSARWNNNRAVDLVCIKEDPAGPEPTQITRTGASGFVSALVCLFQFWCLPVFICFYFWLPLCFAAFVCLSASQNLKSDKQHSKAFLESKFKVSESTPPSSFIVLHEWTVAHFYAPSRCQRWYITAPPTAALKHGLLCLVSGFVQCVNLVCFPLSPNISCYDS